VGQGLSRLVRDMMIVYALHGKSSQFACRAAAGHLADWALEGLWGTSLTGQI
jgi:hypothetical protein